MSDPKREQHPLLGDDFSEDECLPDSPRYQWRDLNKTRTKYSIRGAASIIKQWPDHVSSLLAYWWMGLAMIGFTVLIIYNSVLAIAVIPSPKINKVPSNIKTNDFIEYDAYKTVNMHVIVDNPGVDLSNYIPYIEIISKEHPAFKYNFMILLNDTEYSNNIQKGVDKEISWKTSWKETNLSLETVLNVQRKSLSEFLNESPIKKYWIHLPQQFLGFLIRCISIWNKGGISINPQLFTPESPHPHYIEKVQDIFRRFEENNSKRGRKKSSTTKTKRVNNIRDIIDALDNESLEMDDQLKDVNVAEENKEFLVVDRNTSDWIQKNISVNKKEYTVNKILRKYIPHNMLDVKKVNKYSKDNFIVDSKDDGKTLLPTFLKFLFSPKTNTLHKIEDNSTNEISDSYEINGQQTTFKHTKKFKNTFGKVQNMPINSLGFDYDLNIDLKGNIVATKTSCHAFLGTVFNTVIHHIKDETVTDLIISELSTFCKGNWVYCKGVDVILL
ncbi:uncharacterized protein LOC123715745 [Pieris brassicae]|uniref:uncharacterized protein LOC123715745 n=1 Tax=Pieris brassicae TaxID=7116 RepID=UPI001E65FF4E|nr:uncharacterized protein LOC123715745 [Pieris brassicae]XP_045526955.1 uncharacterized protein LOC123715745 [Pieris brassicae]